MHSLPAGSTQSWFIVKETVALSPILTIWAAGVIAWVRRSTLLQRSEAAPQSRGHPRDELAEAQRSSRSPLQNRTGSAPDLNAGCQASVNDPVTES